MEQVKSGQFAPNIFYENGEPKEFSAIPMAMYADCTPFDSISALLRSFYSEKINLRESARNLRICDGLYQQHWSVPIKSWIFRKSS